MALSRIAGETAVHRLTRYLFDRRGISGAADAEADGAPGAVVGAGAGSDVDPFEAELAAWLAATARFRAFAEANRDKIRKKLRTTPDPEARRDVRAELLVARLLTADKRIQLGFETYGSGKGGPDFTVAFPGERPFNLEVTRPRRPAGGSYDRQLLAKLHQLPPAIPNGVVFAIEQGPPDVAAVEATVHALRRQADRREDAFFRAHGFEGARHFYELFLRLGAVIVFAESSTGGTRASVWVNPSARLPLPPRPLRVCLRALSLE